jgi:hypothetical protein
MQRIGLYVIHWHSLALVWPALHWTDRQRPKDTWTINLNTKSRTVTLKHDRAGFNLTNRAWHELSCLCWGEFSQVFALTFAYLTRRFLLFCCYMSQFHNFVDSRSRSSIPTERKHISYFGLFHCSLIKDMIIYHTRIFHPKEFSTFWGQCINPRLLLLQGL